MAVIFCIGTEVYSYSDVRGYGVEISAERSCGDNNLLSEVDSFDDDHMNQVAEPCLVPEPLTQLPVSGNRFLVTLFSCSNWQPPRHS